MGILRPVQWLRAIAAILVVWAHAIDLVVDRGRHPSHVISDGVENIGAVGVDIFFVISGFIISLTASRAVSARQFALDRLVRVWPMYFLATIVVFSIDQAGVESLEKLGRSLLFMQMPDAADGLPTHPLGWSLFFEMWFYALGVVALLLFKGRSAVLCIGGFLCIAILAGFFTGLTQPANILFNPIVAEFGAGVAIGMVWIGMPQLRIHQGAVAAAFCIGLTLLTISMVRGYGNISEARLTISGELSWKRVMIWGIPSALVVGSAIFWRPPDWARSRPLDFLGAASYSIYLFSFIALLLLGYYWEIWAPTSPDLAVAMAVVVSVSFALFCYVAIERPVTKALRRVLCPAPWAAAATPRADSA